MYLHTLLLPSITLATSLAGHPDHAGQALPAAALTAIAERFADAEPLWRPILRYDPEQRWYERLALTAAVEVWLLSWLPGQRTRIHDHGGAAGAFTVVDGPIAEAVFRPSGQQGAARTVDVPGRRTLHATGTTVTFGAGRVHRVGNGGLAPAATVHVYSPPDLPLRYYTSEPAVAAQADAQ